MHLVVLTQVLDRRDAVLGFFHTWCAAFAGEVDQLTVIAQEVGETDLPANVQVISLGRERGAGRWLMLGRLWRALARLPAPSALLAHMVPRFVLGAAPVARLRKIPMYLWYTHAGVDRALRAATPRVRAVFTASEESFRLKLPGTGSSGSTGSSGGTEKIVTGHGIDVRHFWFGDDARTVDVLAVGRLAPRKGQDELLDALARLPSCPRTEIAGDILLESHRPWRDALRERARNDFGDSVTFLGAVPYPEIAGVMRRARVLVSTSRTGSVDKVVLEAMASGVLPLTCNESFVDIFGAELCERLMYSPGDVEQLARRTSALLALPAAEAEHLGRKLRTKVLVQHDIADLIPRLVSAMRSRS
jgi:glycosyltransferase involved in cell wall biosynthesis